MVTNLMVNRIAETSPRVMARITGVFYLLNILAGILAQGFVSNQLLILSDAAATATNIMSHESLFRLGFALYLIEMTCQVVVTVLFYKLLKPVNSSVSLLAASLSLVGIVIKTFSRLFYIAPLLVLGDAPYLNVFNTQQSQALALLFLNVNDQGAAIGLIFFGFYTVLKGYLIIRSTFLPRILGVLSILAGLSLLSFLHMPLGYRMFPYIALLGLLGAMLQILWLLVFGVNEQRWKEQASAVAESIWS